MLLLSLILSKEHLLCHNIMPTTIRMRENCLHGRYGGHKQTKETDSAWVVRFEATCSANRDLDINTEEGILMYSTCEIEGLFNECLKIFCFDDIDSAMKSTILAY